MDWDFEMYPEADGSDPTQRLIYVEGVRVHVIGDSLTVWKDHQDGTTTFVASIHPSIRQQDDRQPGLTLDLGDEQSIAEAKAVLKRFRA